MSVDNYQREQLAAAGIVMFGVPMGGYSGMLESMLEGAHGDMQPVLNQLAELPYFKSLFAGDNLTVATKLAAAYGFTSVGGGLGQQVKDFFLNDLNNGTTIPQLVKMANDFLFDTVSPDFAEAKALLMNKIAIANFYTYELQGNSLDLTELQTALLTLGVGVENTVLPITLPIVGDYFDIYAKPMIESDGHYDIAASEQTPPAMLLGVTTESLSFSSFG
jgi:hypothetical protein